MESMELYVKNDTDSLLIASGLTADSIYEEFLVPADLDMPNAKMYMKALSTDGQVNTFVSNFTSPSFPKLPPSLKNPAGRASQIPS